MSGIISSRSIYIMFSCVAQVFMLRLQLPAAVFCIQHMHRKDLLFLLRGTVMHLLHEITNSSY